MANPVRSEDEYGQKVDRCLYNSMVKFVGGMGVGIVCSVLLFKRKPWPLILGSGLGIGMGVSDCNHEFRGTARKLRTSDVASGIQHLSGMHAQNTSTYADGVEQPDGEEEEDSSPDRQ